MQKQRFWDLCCTCLNEGYFPQQNLKAIKEFLSSKIKGKNLDIGGGWHSYTKNYCVLDISEKSLQRNQDSNKIKFDLDTLALGHYLPFQKNTFDTSTLISVAHYLPSIDKLLQELKRVIKPLGRVYLIQGHNNFLKPIEKFMPTDNDQFYNQLLQLQYNIHKEEILGTNKRDLIQSFEINFN